MSDIERRTFSFQDIEVRADEGRPAKMVGYASVFNSHAVIMTTYKEIVDPGAFSKTLGADVRALFNHDPNIVLGRTKSKTLSLRVDNRGLYVEIDPPDTQVARDLMKSMERGDVDQMSFGFRTVKDKWHRDEDGMTIRTLLEVELFDVSPVTMPAYPDTTIALRSLEKSKDLTPGDAAKVAAEARSRLLTLAEFE